MVDIVVPVSLFLMIFAIVYVIYTTRNKERMALIERGADPKLFKSMSRGSGYSDFKWGLFMVGVAIGVFLGVLIEQNTTLEPEHMYVAMILVCGGLALMAAYLLRGKIEKRVDKPQ